ncbi:prohibitin-3, mitochondrial-like [Andrographis paniculata]|uniref:prohibitin-3, mitochondrial-like n=1 Tax=Andrographis paniculata TaxID=175694 RepID=UPI0021E7BE60|nr:prohibitin-3, mitochondrial-like [Andrographis paniculata]
MRSRENRMRAVEVSSRLTEHVGGGSGDRLTALEYARIRIKSRTRTTPQSSVMGWGHNDEFFDAVEYGKRVQRLLKYGVRAIYLPLLASTVIGQVFYTTESGHRGVIFHRFLGVLNYSVGEGAHFYIPWLQKPYIFDVRTRPYTFSSVIGTKDLQEVELTVRVLSHPQLQSLPKILETLGHSYDQNTLLPSIVNNVVRKVVAQLNADQLLSQHSHVSKLVREAMVQKAKESYIFVDDVSITDLSYSEEFVKSVEQKQVAKVEEERSKLAVAKAEQEKKAVVIKSEGESECAKLISDATTAAGLGLIQLRKIEASKTNAMVLGRNGNVMYIPNKKKNNNINMVFGGARR